MAAEKTDLRFPRPHLQHVWHYNTLPVGIQQLWASSPRCKQHLLITAGYLTPFKVNRQRTSTKDTL